MQPMAMVPPPTKRKGGIALGLGIIFVVLGIAGGIYGLVSGFTTLQHRVDELQRVPLSQGGALRLTESGSYKVFVERPSKGYSATPNIAITSPAGERIPLQFDSVSETYDVGGRHGRKIGKILISEPGDYGFSVPSGLSGGQGQLAVGRRSPLGALAAIVSGVVIGGGTVVAGIILLILGGIRRSRSKQPPLGGYPGGGAWAAPPAMAPGAGGWNQPANPGGWAPPPPSPAPSWAPPQTDANTTWNPPPPPPPS